MEGEKGDPEEVQASPDFGEVEETYDETEYEDFRDDVRLAFPEDTVAFDELLDGRAAATDDQSEGARDRTGDDGNRDEGRSTAPPERNESGATATSPGQADSIVARLVDELEEERPSESAVAALREELGVTSQQNVEVRLRHLQTQVSDLTAYIDALEEFLDDRGSAKRVLESVESDLESIESQVEELERAHDADHSQLRDRLAAVEEDVAEHAALQEDLAEARQQTNDLAEQLAATDETARQATDRIVALEEDVSTALEELERRHASLRDELEEVQRTHRQLAQVLEGASAD